jgi:hypothetical protein
MAWHFLDIRATAPLDPRFINDDVDGLGDQDCCCPVKEV